MENPLHPDQVDLIIGSVLTFLGGTGVVINIVTVSLSLAVLGINLVIGIGGLYILYYKIKKINREKH